MHSEIQYNPQKVDELFFAVGQALGRHYTLDFANNTFTDPKAKLIVQARKDFKNTPSYMNLASLTEALKLHMKKEEKGALLQKIGDMEPRLKQPPSPTKSATKIRF